MSAMDKPTVLLVGTGERMKDALGAALERHRLMVESVPADRAVDAAFVAAPDLVVLIGDAAAEGGRVVLAKLAESPVTATVPVVLLTDEAGLDRRLSAFKHGVVAVVPRTASADGMARSIAEVARELPERSGETAGELGAATVDELVALFSQQLRTGILSVTSGASDASAQVVLRAGRPVTEAIEELVERLRPLVKSGEAGPLRYEFHESTSARLTLLESEAEPEDAALLRDRRIVLVEQNPARADVLVQELRAQGALVVVADGEGTGLDRARSLDPEVVILDGSGVHGWALPALRALRRDPRLRWASLLVVDTAELWPRGASGPDLARLAASLKPLVRADRELFERAQREESFDTRLEVIGPTRTLRALTQTSLGLRVSTSHTRARVEIDLADGLVAGARALGPSGRQIAEGPAALAALLAIGSGRVRVERKEAPASANVMSPLDDALAAAANERAPIQPSIPPPSGISEPPGTASEPPGEGDADRLIGRLEELLERLQKVLPAAEAAASRVDEEAPTRKQAGVPKPAKAIPPPRRQLPPSRRKGATTMVLGSVQAPPRPAEDDEDLPEIEATAEPGASAPSSAAPPATPEPPEAPRPRVPPPFDPAPPTAPEPNVVIAPELAAAVPPPAAPFAPPAAPAVAPAPAPVEAWPDEPAPPKRGRGLLWFAAAFLLTLVVGGGAAAAYLYYGRGATDVVHLPVTDQQGAQPATDGPERPVGPAAAADAGADLSAATAAADPAAPADAGSDGGSDAGSDAGADAGSDAGSASGADGGPAGELEGPDEESDPDEEVPSDGPEPTSRPERIAHLVRLANYQRNQANLAEAERNYQAVLRLDGRNARALVGLVRLNMQRGTNDQALRWARRLVAARPRNAANHVLLGDVLAATGNRRAATASWRRALELSPSLRSARERLGGGP